VTRVPLRLRPLPSALSSPGRQRRRHAVGRWGCCPEGQAVGGVGGSEGVTLVGWW